MLVLAGPGSGKTKVLTERIRILIEEHNVNPNQILVITFSKKAAIEMKNRFDSLFNGNSYPVNFGTFHSVFYQILKNHKNYNLDSILTEKDKISIISEIGFNLKIEKASSPSWQKEIIKMISAYKNNGEDYLSCLYISDKEKEDFIKLYKYYMNECRLNNKLDYDDMILECLDMFMKHESILRVWREYFKYILVDEFQDINESQYKILRLLAGDNKNIFCVGDDDQSIYAFRGAKPSIMQRFLREFSATRRIDLSINYRCAQKIVDASDKLIKNNKVRIDRNKQQVSDKNNLGVVKVIESLNTIEQAETVCKLIYSISREKNLNYNDFAVLYRSGHCAKMFEIKANEMKLPIFKSNDKFNLYDNKVCRVIISYFRMATLTANRTDILLCINTPKRELSREAFTDNDNLGLNALYKYYDQDNAKISVIDELKKDLNFIKYLTPISACIYILKKLKLYEELKMTYTSNDSICFDELLELFIEKLREFDTINGFLDSIEYRNKTRESLVDECVYAKSKNDMMDRVNLLTAHASKGLEYKIVFIIGLQEGDFPHNKSLHGLSLEEERRLMYVAMTRAKEELYLCSISSGHAKSLSRFISEALILS